MDWAAGFMGAYAPQPQEDVEDDEDFYGQAENGDTNEEADTVPGAQMDETVREMSRSSRVPLTTMNHTGH